MSTAAASAYRVVHAAVTAKGARGSVGLFYQGDLLRPWDTGDAGTDHADDTEISRLLNMGCIEPVSP
jgi:hypothetical protein